MKLDVLNNQNKVVDNVELSDDIFKVSLNNELISNYVRVFQFNQRQGTSSTKTRGEVSGGGRKPWKQKGTGRARHGSTRTPIWVHGGIAHGPKPKDWSLNINKKVKKLALKIALSIKSMTSKLFVIDSLEVTKPSTSLFAKLLATLNLHGSVLVITVNSDKNVLKSFSNIPSALVSHVGVLNAYEVLKAKNVLFTKEAIVKLEERLS